MCARGAALVGVGPVLMEANYGSETALSLGARPCSEMPAAASNELQVFARAHANVPLCALSQGRRRTTRACDARARRRDGWSRSRLDGSQLR